MQKIIIPFIFSLLLIACNQPQGNTETTGNIVMTDVFTVTADSVYSSTLRPGEQLKLNTVYTDTILFLEYEDNYDYFMLIAKKGDEIVSFVNDDKHRNLNKGDIITVSWQLDSIVMAGDDDMTWITEWAKEITKINDGKLSLFRKGNNKPINYFYVENYSDYFNQKCTNELEYFLANTNDKAILQFLHDGKGEIEVHFSNYWDEGEEIQKGCPTVTANVENFFDYHYTPIIKLGIEFDSENSSTIYYKFDEQDNKYVLIK